MKSQAGRLNDREEGGGKRLRKTKGRGVRELARASLGKGGSEGSLGSLR